MRASVVAYRYADGRRGAAGVHPTPMRILSDLTLFFVSADVEDEVVDTLSAESALGLVTNIPEKL